MSASRAFLLPNGKLLVPMRAELDDGMIIGDGMVEIEPGSPDYEAWLPFVDENPGRFVDENPGRFVDENPGAEPDVCSESHLPDNFAERRARKQPRRPQ